MVMTTPVPRITRDRGQTWTQVRGLPAMARPVADRVNSTLFYALDFSNGAWFISTDGGATFKPSPSTGLPDIRNDAPRSTTDAWPLHATEGKEGDLWFVSGQGLFHSIDGGKIFKRSVGTLSVEALSFGKSPKGGDYPALFALGRQDNTRAVWRSDDQGVTWLRLNDERHQWGTRFRCIAADPRIFGRVYIGTDGRGILYGEPAPAGN